MHAAWGLALSRRIREEYGLESDAIWSDDGIIVHLPDADEPPGADLVLVDPDELEDAVVAELGTSALFGARFRENAARSLLIPRAYPGKRTPLWQQRLKSQSLLEVARRYAQFPIVLETYRECLRDVLDLPGLTELLRGLHRREINVVEVETPTASPFASSLLFDYVATYMYEGDTPNAERRAAALSLDRELLRELLGQEELRELIDPGALEQVELDLQHRSDRTRADSRDALADVLRRLGDLTDVEVADRVLAGLDPAAMLGPARGRAPRRAPARGRRGALDRRRRRRACTATPSAPSRPAGCPRPSWPTSRRRWRSSSRATRAPTARSPPASCASATCVDPTSALTALERAGELVRGELRPSGSEREWCDPEVLRRLRRASLAVLRKEIEAADQRALAAFLPSWQGVDRHPAGGAGVDRLREVLVPLQGLALPADVWERDVLPRRCGAYSPTWLDQLCASGEVVWVGAGALGRNSGRVALYFRDDVEAIGPPPNKSERPDTPEHDLLRERLAQAPCFFTDLLAELAISPEQIQEALWDLVWAGEVTNDAWAPLRAPRLTLARAQRAARSRRRPGRRFGSRRAGAQAQVQGRWSLTTLALPRRRSSRAPAGARWPSCCSSATASSPASRCWPRGSPAASRSSTTPSASSRRSACAGAATSSRASAARSSRCPAPSSACARSAPTRRRRRSCWPPPTRRSPTARRCRGPSATTRRGARSAWPAPTSSSPAPSPCVYVERGGKGIAVLVEADDARIAPGARGAGARSSPPGAGASSRSSASTASRWSARAWEARLIELGFRAGPRKLTLSA